jgi:D-aminoacyl-tRNA deacylase
VRVIIQRVSASQVTVAGQVIGSIGLGLNILVGIAASDTLTEVDWIANKCLSLRLFPKDEQGRFDLSVQDIGGELLVISQFTLYGDCRKGKRPSFEQAAAPDQAKVLYEYFIEKLKKSSLKVQSGQFGASMQVMIANQGPVTIVLEREANA